MGKLTDKLIGRAKQDDPYRGVSSQERSPKYDFVTVMGRRVRVGKLMGEHRSRLMIATKGVEGRRGNQVVRTEDWEFHRWLIRELVSEIGEDNREKFVDYQQLTIGEERDMILLIRLATYGRDFHMQFQCPHCGHKSVPYLDPCRIKRWLIHPTQDQNAWPAHHVVEVGDEKQHIAILLSQYDPSEDVPDDSLSVDWSELPTDYYQFIQKNHRKWSVKLPESQIDVAFHLPMARDKKDIADFYINDDPTFIETALSYMVVSMGDVEYAEKDGTISVEKRKELHTRLRALSSKDLLTLRDKIIDEDIGVETLVHITCDKATGGCGTVFDTEIRMDADFFLPPRVSSNSSTRTQRYQRRSR